MIVNTHFKRYIPLITRISILCIVALSLYLFTTTILSFILPFALAWGISAILEPFVHFLTNRFRLSRNLSSFIAVSVFVLFVGSLIALIGGTVFFQIIKLSQKLPENSQKIYQQGTDLSMKIQKLYTNLPPDIAHSITKEINTLTEYFTSLLMKSLSLFIELLSALPTLFLFITVTIISTFFMSRDKEKIIAFITAKLPHNALLKGNALKKTLEFTLLGYIKAQFILMLVTFIASAIGLNIIGIDYFLLIALLASVVDALPMLGTGCIYLPIILWVFLCGEYQKMINLGILYTTIIFIHQLLEPKILGNQIGLYPLVTLMSMYIGFKLFGILGFIIGPVCIMFFISLQNTDILPKSKRHTKL